MKICPNPECGHRLRAGAPAEYKPGVEHCTDCGAGLVEKNLSASISARPQEAEPLQRSLLIRVGSTLGLLALQVLLGHIPLPGVDVEPLQHILASTGTLDVGVSLQLSVIALGIMPFIAAALLVEIVALSIPKLRRLRTGGPASRLALHRATLAVTLVVAAIQSYFVCSWIRSISDPYWASGDMVPDSNVWFFITGMATHVAAVLLLVGIAHAITRYGIGNGFSVLIGWSLLTAFVPGMVGLFHAVMVGVVASSDVLLLLGGAVAVVYATVWLSGRTISSREDGLPAGFGVHLPTCGLVPIGTAASLLFLPVQLFSVSHNFGWRLPLDGIVDALVPGSALYLACNILLIGAVGYVLSRLFYRPTVISRFLNECHHADPDFSATQTPEIRDLVFKGTTRSLLFLGGLAIFSHLLTNTGVSIGVIVIIPLIMIVLDLRQDWRALREFPTLTKIWELHRMYAVDTAQGILTRVGIPCHVRGVYHRSLLYFFGPYIPIDILVPPKNAAEGTRCLQEAFSAPDPGVVKG